MTTKHSIARARQDDTAAMAAWAAAQGVTLERLEDEIQSELAWNVWWGQETTADADSLIVMTLDRVAVIGPRGEIQAEGAGFASVVSALLPPQEDTEEAA